MTISVFGCLCYVHNNEPQRHKFAPCSKPSICVGYPLGQRGYRMFDLDTKTIHTSRDVIFRKNEFPFKLITSNPNHSHVVLPNPIQELDSTSVLGLSHNEPNPSPTLPSSVIEEDAQPNHHGTESSSTSHVDSISQNFP